MAVENCYCLLQLFPPLTYHELSLWWRIVLQLGRLYVTSQSGSPVSENPPGHFD